MGWPLGGKALVAIGSGPSVRLAAGSRPATMPATGRTGARPAKSRGKSAEKATAKPSPQPGAPTAARPAKKDPEHPLVVKADLIRVQVMREGDESKVSEVYTE